MYSPGGLARPDMAWLILAAATSIHWPALPPQASLPDYPENRRADMLEPDSGHPRANHDEVEFMSLTQSLIDLIKEIPAAAIQKARIELITDQLKLIEAGKAASDKRVAELENRVAELEEENADLRGKIVAQVKASPFEEHEGVLWKREPDGGVKPIAYCPNCQMAMSVVRAIRYPDNKVECSLCHFKAPFQPYRVEQIAAELSKK